MWYLLQGGIMFAVFAANIHWQIIAHNNYAVAFVGGLAAYGATAAINSLHGLWLKISR